MAKTKPPITDAQIIEILWSLSLSDHMGDVAEAIEPMTARFGIPLCALSCLNDELEKRGLVPEWAKEDDE